LKLKDSVGTIICRLVAHAIKTLGLDKGSAIAIDMPMHVNSVVIYLAIVLAGYVVVSIADSFASCEISTRLKISEAKAIFTQVIALFSFQTFHLEFQFLWVVFAAQYSSKNCLQLFYGILCSYSIFKCVFSLN
jgi:acyl-coenzyme A synthetase/AMP-(fatty) acid ligase